MPQVAIFGTIPLKKPPKVLVVSDVRLFREGIAAVLTSTSLKVVGAVALDRLAPYCAMLTPDAVLVDAQILRTSGTLGAFGLSPSSVVIGFGVSDSAEDILACAGSGLSGFVGTDASAEDIVLAVEGTLRGEFPCPPKLARILLQKLSSLAQSGATGRGGTGERLTNRELAVARLLDQGHSNKEIARQLNIGVTTVKNHLHNIFEKLDVHRRGEAAAALRGILNISIQNRVAS